MPSTIVTTHYRYKRPPRKPHSLGAKEFDKLLKLPGHVCSGGADQAHILAMRCH